MKSDLLANMSHELRTPLNAIIGFAELIHDGDVTPEMPQYREFLGDILTSARHLLRLINDMVDLSKLEAGKLEFYPETVSLTALLGDVVGALGALAAEKAMRLEYEVDRGLTDIVLDATRMKQVLYAYLSNALKFTSEGGRVVVRLRPETPETFRVEVEDSGVGIGAEDVARLFVEFQKLDVGAIKRRVGSGLGLALTKRLVEAQGGSVGVKSTLGHGSCFHAVLPRKAASITSRPAPPERSPTGQPPGDA